MARRSEQYIAAKSAELTRKNNEDWERRKRFRQSVGPLNAEPTTTAEKQVVVASDHFMFVEATSRNNKTPQREQSHVPCTLVYRSVLKKNKQASKQLIINMLLAGMFVYPNSLAAFTAPGEIMF